MLVMSRCPGEAIVIGDITIRLLEFRGKRAVIGIQAPLEVPIVREELIDPLALRSADAPAIATELTRESA